MVTGEPIHPHVKRFSSDFQLVFDLISFQQLFKDLIFTIIVSERLR